MTTIGEKIKSIAKAKKISLRQIALETGLSKTTLSELTTNKKTNPQKGTIEKIARALGVPAGLLLADEQFIERAAEITEHVTQFNGTSKDKTEKLSMLKDLIKQDPEIYLEAIGIMDPTKFIGPLTDDEKKAALDFLKIYRSKGEK